MKANHKYNRFYHMKYTAEHRKAFRKMEKKLFGKTTFRGCMHDFDKLIMYPFLGVKLTNKIHRKLSRHHPNRAHTFMDYCQMIVDWECARFTKPDKPLNAYSTLYKYNPELEGEILPILKVLNLGHKVPTPDENILDASSHPYQIWSVLKIQNLQDEDTFIDMISKHSK